MRTLHLFAGIGGSHLCGELMGWTSVGSVEIDPYCQRILRRHYPEEPIHDDVRTFDGRPLRGRCDLICGGFPCQDISVAGKGAGIDGERSGLWAEFARIIREVRPGCVFVENVPALTSRGLGRVLGDLAALGFDAEWGCLSAAQVGANHRRDRLWILAYANGERVRHVRGRRGGEAGEGAPELADDGTAGTVAQPSSIGRGEGRAESARQQGGLGTAGGSPSMAHAHGGRQLQPGGAEPEERGRPGHGCGEVGHPSSTGLAEWERATGQRAHAPAAGAGWWAVEPDVGRVAHGIPHRVDRIRGLGNAWSPLQAAEAFRMLWARASSTDGGHDMRIGQEEMG